MTENKTPAPGNQESTFDRIGPYTAIPNDVFEAVLCSPLSRSDLKVFLSILRFTYGFHKTTDSISISQLSEMAGLSTRMTIFSVQNLEAKKMIQVQRKRGRGHKNEINSITVNQKPDKWVVKEKSAQYDNALKKRKKLYEKSGYRVVKENEGGERNCNLVVKENAFSSERSFTHKRNPKENKTTTPESVCVDNSFLNSVEPPPTESKVDSISTEANRYGISEAAMEFIELETERASAAGQIRSTKGAYRHGLIKKAKDELLDISGLGELRQQVKPQPKLPGLIEAAIQRWRDSCGKTPWDAFCDMSREDFEDFLLDGDIQLRNSDAAFGSWINDGEGGFWVVVSPEDKDERGVPENDFNPSHRLERQPDGKIRVYDASTPNGTEPSTDAETIRETISKRKMTLGGALTGAAIEKAGDTVTVTLSAKQDERWIRQADNHAIIRDVVCQHYGMPVQLEIKTKVQPPL